MDFNRIRTIKAISTINPPDMMHLSKLDMIQKFIDAKQEHPTFKKHQLCELLGISDSTLKRYMKDYDIPSAYRHKVATNKSKKKVDKVENVEKRIRGRQSNKAVKAGNSFDDTFNDVVRELEQELEQ